MISVSDLRLAIGMESSYAQNILDCLFTTAGGQHKTAGRVNIYLFNEMVSEKDLLPFLSKKRESAIESKRKLKHQPRERVDGDF